MPTNDQVILGQFLSDKKTEIAPDLTEPQFFELFAAEQVLKDYDLSNDDIESGVVGAGGDGGIDSIHVFINGELLHEDTDLSIYRGDISIEAHIVQAKRAQGFDEDAIHRLRSSAEVLLDLSKYLEDLAPVYNSRLLTIVSKFRDAHTRFASRLPRLSVHYYYATLGAEVHPNVERQVASLKETVTNLFSSAAFSFDFLGARRLLELARTQPTTTHELKLAETPISVNNSFICLVDLSDYRDFISDENGRYRRIIFDANVRDYQGDVEVNRAIRATLLERPGDEDFWWLNNGVTILATDSSLSGKTITLRDPQVVNGLQTSQEIFRAITHGGAPDGRRLLVRVIARQSPLSYQRIVRATNSQTTVPQASLRATDRIHRDIEDFLNAHKLYYERRKNFYRNEGRPREGIVGISYLAQAVMAIVLDRPDDARARPSTLLKNDADYKQVFDPAYPVSIYLVCARLMKRTEEFLRAKGIPQKDINNLKYHLAMFASRIALNKLNPTPAQVARLNVDRVDGKLLESSFLEVQPLYHKLGSDDQVAKGPTFVKDLRERLSRLVYATRLTPRA